MQPDNPARRLYDLLTAYRERASQNVTVVETWTEVLGPDRVRIALAAAAGLIDDVERAVAAIGDEFQLGVVRHFSDKWATPLILPNIHPFSRPSSGSALVDPDALVALGGVASFLSASGWNNILPNETQLTDARTHIVEALDLITEADDLPEHLRLDIAVRLHEVLWALDHVKIAGAEPVTAAMERLAGTIAIKAPDSARLNQRVKKILALVGAVWVVFTASPQIDNALESWSHLSKVVSGDEITPPGPSTPPSTTKDVRP